MKSFQGKVAAITGAGSGIGRALALNLAQRGCELALSDINGTGLLETIALVRDSGVKASHHILDVAKREAVYSWADAVVAEHGRVNMIFNNAGVAHSSTIAAMDYDELEWIMNINLWGVIHGTKAFLPHLEASGEGHVINMSSLSGFCAQPAMASYNLTKFAVRGFTEALRIELDLQDSCVSATSIHPGGIKTNIAKASKIHPSVEALMGQSAEQGRKEFEKLFITTADKAAQIIVRGVERNRRRMLVGPDAKMMDFIVRLLPSLYQRLVVAVSKRQFMR
ncbi:MAG: SDR family NAD(P)-dependent oxidoreductase [Oceanococcus sp.]